MNILIVGNGFDLAHKLPTTYMDFLKFMNNLRRIIENKGIKCIHKPFDADIKKELKEKNLYINEYFEDWLNKNVILKWDGFLEEKSVFVKIFQEKNIWFTYFHDKVLDKSMKGEKWIDFENEIATVIRCLETCIYNSEKEAADKNKTTSFNFEYFINKYLMAFIDNNGKCLNLNGKNNYINKLETDLNLFIDCLESYMMLINKMQNVLKSPDIKKHNFDKVLSFNYTNTYKEVYEKELVDDNIDFIHGKAGNHNLVLGTEETLKEETDVPEMEKLINKEISCIRFKKYFQRIYKQTGLKYKDWLENPYTGGMAVAKPTPHNIYVFGHSLDIPDKDILNYVITHKSVAQTTIYYHDEDAHARQIANLVKVIGKTEMIERTGNGNIVFQQQQEMIPRLI